MPVTATVDDAVHNESVPHQKSHYLARAKRDGRIALYADTCPMGNSCPHTLALDWQLNNLPKFPEER